MSNKDYGVQHERKMDELAIVIRQIEICMMARREALAKAGLDLPLEQSSDLIAEA